VSTYLKDTLKIDHLDHLIYTAGDRLPTIPIEEITLENFSAGILVRGPSALLSIKTFLPLLPKANTTSIILTSGSICDKPIPGGWAITSFVGSGLNGLTRQLALDLAPIRVNCVAPGVVDTDLWSHMEEKERKGLYEQMEKSLPTGRVPSADDLAESYVYLLRDRNVTGTTIHSNGGAFL
jgi:NAD(P)-dependent dehydrogenase (short-subunit alcohol dehydrogenase family)